MCYKSGQFICSLHLRRLRMEEVLEAGGIHGVIEEHSAQGTRPHALPKFTIKNEFLLMFQTHMLHFVSPNW